MDLNYPVWSIFGEEQIRSKDWAWPDRFYFYNPDGHDRKPAALYVIGYKRGGYGDTYDLFGRLVDYIEANEYEICGSAYVEYPMNEICINDQNNYLIRAMISVKKKDGKKMKEKMDS